MLPMIEAFTSSISPARSATMAIMSSAALPKVALSSPPTAGPLRLARCSVASPMYPASGMMAAAARANTRLGDC